MSKISLPHNLDTPALQMMPGFSLKVYSKCTYRRRAHIIYPSLTGTRDFHVTQAEGAIGAVVLVKAERRYITPVRDEHRGNTALLCLVTGGRSIKFDLPLAPTFPRNSFSKRFRPSLESRIIYFQRSFCIGWREREYLPGDDQSSAYSDAMPAPRQSVCHFPGGSLRRSDSLNPYTEHTL